MTISRKDSVMIANIASKRRPRGVYSAVRAHRPAVVIISEAYYADTYLHKVATRLGYRYSRPRASGYDGTVGMMVRKGLSWSGASTTSTNRKWKFRDRVRNPRLYLRSWLTLPTFDDDRVPLRVLGLHLEPYGPKGKNGPQWKASMDLVNAWFDRKPKTASLAAGDINALASEVRNHTPHKVTQGGKVDHFISRGLQILHTRKLRTPFGMHGWYLMTFRVDVPA